jgi:hypothetical protein
MAVVAERRRCEDNGSEDDEARLKLLKYDVVIEKAVM